MAVQDDKRLADELRSVVWDLNRRIKEETEPVTNLSSPHLMALVRLDRHPGMTQAELARAERVRPQSIQTTLAPLVDAGYVEVRPDEHDARLRRLYVTPSAQELLRRIRSIRSDWLAQRIRNRFDATERDRVQAALPLLRRLLDEDDPAHP